MANEQSSFENALATDMQALAAEIRNQRKRPEMKGAGEKELLKEAIRAFPALENDQQAGASAAATPPPAPTDPSSHSPLPGYAQNAPAEVKLEIEYLLEITLRDGLTKALIESKKSPYFVQDAFHDALAGKLYPELQKRGIVK
jgi:hypothetical protein